jgi:hypothetical protein
MCEILAVASTHPMWLGDVLAWGKKVEHFGIAGFGWGVAWLSPEGQLRVYRRPTSLAEDAEGRSRLAGESGSRILLHLRRPNRLSTIHLADTQPFADDSRQFAFVHNGKFKRDASWRERFRAVLNGRADSEVGFHLYASLLAEGTPREALIRVHKLLGGTANLGYLSREGELILYGGNRGNAFYGFQLGDLCVACTALHSDDASIFDLVFGRAAEKTLIARRPVALSSSLSPPKIA